MALHRNLTGADLHEPKGVASAAAGTVYVANGSGSGSWQTLEFPEIPTPTIVVESNTQLPVSPKGTTLISDGENWLVHPNTVGYLVEQTAHGFSTGQPVYYDGSAWVLAQADDPVSIGTHIVYVLDVDNFTAVISGVITGMTGLTPGAWYFTSEATPGILTEAEPLTGYSNPMGQALNATTFMVISYRAQEIA